VLALEQVGDAALAGLAVDAHDGLIGAAHVVGVDRQVRHFPDEVVDAGRRGAVRHILLHGVEPLLDGVLV